MRGRAARESCGAFYVLGFDGHLFVDGEVRLCPNVRPISVDWLERIGLGVRKRQNTHGFAAV